MNVFSQSFFIPDPPITEKNCPDQTGRVHIVTGGYTGIGLELSKILYAANATLYIAGRSSSKAFAALDTLRTHAPSSTGRLAFLQLDLSDLSTIKPAVDEFKSKETALHVLTNNAGVMVPPLGSKDAQGNELQIGTNLYGAFLLTRLLYPVLQATAKREDTPRGSVRVTWAGSMGVDVSSYKPGGMALDEEGQPIDKKDAWLNYGQTKAGNLWLANEFARRFGERDGIVHVCWNPGNLRTELQRHVPWWQAVLLKAACYPAQNGAYTELFAAVGEELKEKPENQMDAWYVWPFGRTGSFREDIRIAMLQESQGGTGQATRFYDWVEKYTEKWT